MPDKSFEEQVREELSGLRMKPDSSVWEQVALRLEKRRRRRWGAWLFILLFCLLGAAGWWIVEEGMQTRVSSFTAQPNVQTPQQENATEKSAPSVLEKEQEASKLRNSKKAINGFSGRMVLATTGDAKKNRVIRIKQFTTPIIQQSQVTAMDISKQKSEAAAVTAEALKSILQTNKTDSPVAAQQPAVSLVTQSKADTSSVNNDMVVSITQQPAIKTMADKIIANNDSSFSSKQPSASDSSITLSSPAVTINKNSRKRWEWGVQINTGLSGFRNSLGAVFNTSGPQGYNAPLYSNVSSPAPTLSSRPGANDAFSYGVAVHTRKYIGKRQKNAIDLSLGYDHYAVTTAIGLPRTGTISFDMNNNVRNEANQFFSTSDSSRYRSKYHFIRIGVTYQHRLSWLGKRELMLVGGVGLNSLISTNGLHLGISNNTYYFFKNRSLFHQWQLDMVFGADISLNRSGSLQIGPRIQYMFTELTSQVNNEQHLFRPGIQFNYWFKKKR